jgi:hypothetical protein
VRGHRVSNCQHSDRPLQHINKKVCPFTCVRGSRLTCQRVVQSHNVLIAEPYANPVQHMSAATAAKRPIQRELVHMMAILRVSFSLHTRNVPAAVSDGLS